MPVLRLPEVVIAEASRMIGYLGGRHNLTVTGWGETKTDWQDFMADTGVRLMQTVLEQWQMLPPATPPQAGPPPACLAHRQRQNWQRIVNPADTACG